jgi:hypothetical protein
MIEINPSPKDKKASYGWATRIRDGKPIVYLRCPSCGDYAALDDHKIANDGVVSPSVICPFGGCTFHDTIKLLGWKEAA